MHEEESFEAKGVIRFRMPEPDIDLPLWGDDGLLPWEPALLQAGLGVSAETVDDLISWGAAWNARHRVVDPEAQELRLMAAAEQLVERMRSELKPGLRVDLHLR